MAHGYKSPVNYRTSASQVTDEPFTIEGGTALLAEAPYDPNTLAITVRVNNVVRTRVTGQPNVGEYRIRTQAVTYADQITRTEYLPVLEFHANDEGASGTATYWRTGTTYTAEFFSSMVGFLRPLTGVASVNDLPTPTTNPALRGCPGDMAFLTDGSFYFSDGDSWNNVAAGVATALNYQRAANADAVIQTLIEKIAYGDAQVGEVFNYTRTADADAFLQANFLRTASGDGVIQATMSPYAQGQAYVDTTGGSPAAFRNGSSYTTGTGGSISIPYPTGTQVGDLLFVAANYTDGFVPSGWTAQINNGNQGAIYAWRYADATSGNFICTPGDDGSGEDPQVWNGRMWAFSSVAASDPFFAAETTGNNFLNATSKTCTTWGSVPAGSLYFVVAGFGGAGKDITVGGGFTNRFATTGAQNLALAYGTNVSGSVTAGTLSWSGAETGSTAAYIIKGT